MLIPIATPGTLRYLGIDKEEVTFSHRRFSFWKLTKATLASILATLIIIAASRSFVLAKELIAAREEISVLSKRCASK